MGKKKLMGRPPLKNPRRAKITFKVTAAEKRAILAQAKAAGITVGAWVRSRILGE